MINRTSVVTLFARMTADGIDPSQPLLWGYYFTGHDERKLHVAAPLLAAQGYRVVDISPADAKPGTPPRYYLHIERAERHSVDSLDARNHQFHGFAAEQGLDYDGMDVGRVDGKPFKSDR